MDHFFSAGAGRQGGKLREQGSGEKHRGAGMLLRNKADNAVRGFFKGFHHPAETFFRDQRLVRETEQAAGRGVPAGAAAGICCVPAGSAVLFQAVQCGQAHADRLVPVGEVVEQHPDALPAAPGSDLHVPGHYKTVLRASLKQRGCDLKNILEQRGAAEGGQKLVASKAFALSGSHDNA